MGKLSEARFETYIRHITNRIEGRRLDKARESERMIGEEDDMEIGGLVRNKTTIAEGKRRHKAFMANFPKMQFERALSKAVEGRATPEDIGYVFRHASDFGQTENVGQEKEVAVIIFDKDINL